jgi:hypothetical protein
VTNPELMTAIYDDVIKNLEEIKKKKKVEY